MRFLIRGLNVLGPDSLDDVHGRCDYDLVRHCGGCWRRNAGWHLTLCRKRTYADGPCRHGPQRDFADGGYSVGYGADDETGVGISGPCPSVHSADEVPHSTSYFGLGCGFGYTWHRDYESLLERQASVKVTEYHWRRRLDHHSQAIQFEPSAFGDDSVGCIADGRIVQRRAVEIGIQYLPSIFLANLREGE